MAARKLAKLLGFKVVPGGNHMKAITKEGKAIPIPHSIKNYRTAMDIINDFIEHSK